MDNQQTMPLTDDLYGLNVDTRVAFSNQKNIYKKGIEKRQRKLMQDVAQFIKPFLGEGEKILLVTTGCSPMGFMEQLLTGWIIYYLKRSLIIFTARRILHVPTTSGFKYRNSIAQIKYGDVKSLSMSWGSLVVAYKNGKREKFYYIPSSERAKIKQLLKETATNDGVSRESRRAHLCPRCTTELVTEQYECVKCHLQFKSRNEAQKISIIFPGGGYFYTGHWFMGIMDAMAELVLTIVVIGSFIGWIGGSAKDMETFFITLVMLIVEKLITISHSSHFVDEYIPKEREIGPVQVSR
ncbi:MAG: hypothetical protein WC889_07530 [Myxococcota bacterium]